MSEYNINELLDMRKHLEAKQKEVENSLTPQKLCTMEETERDLMNGKERQIRKSDVHTLEDIAAEHAQVTSELVKVKTAITKYNATVLQDKLFKREECRNKIAYMNSVKKMLPMNPEYTKQIISQSKEGVVQLLLERKVIPSFSREAIDKMTDQFAKEERKLNTEIQKLNLEQKIEV